jgi:hypothetical protein
MKLYICGPMTGIEDFNRPAFNRAARELTAAGYEVGNPAWIEYKSGMSWLDCMRKAIPLMMTCDALALLPGWEYSRGARAEMSLAVDLGISATTVRVWLERAAAEKEVEA